MARRHEKVDEVFAGLVAATFPDQHGVDAWQAFIRVHAGLMRLLDTDLREKTGFGLNDFDVIASIAGAGGRLRMSELADRAMVSRSGLTRRVARLVDEGLVKRDETDDDGRGVVVSLTKAGVARLKQVTPVHLREVKRLFVDRLSNRELIVLEQALRKLVVDCDFG